MADSLSKPPPLEYAGGGGKAGHQFSDSHLGGHFDVCSDGLIVAALMRRKTVIIVVLAVIVCAAGGVTWWLTHRPADTGQLVLYGNVDLRQAEIAFNNNERIAAVLVQEGDRVHRGQLLARLDTGRLQPQVDQASAMVDAQRQVVERLHNGNRPEEIAEARANAESARADAANAKVQYERFANLAKTSSGAVRQQDLDNAKAALDVAEAKLLANQKALELELIGPRKEDVAQAEAQLRTDEAQLALLRQQLADAQLLAPLDGVIRSRLMEPGDMASPQKPAFSLAIVDPKWVRAYVSEPDLGKVHPGDTATVAVDSFPDKRFEGWVGFISPMAEFTPKTVQTQELRTSLVYEVRVFVKDPADDLRLGMPATVYLPVRQKNAGATSARHASRTLSAPMPVLLGRDIHKGFRRETGEPVKALDGVNLEANHGTLTALVGPDGAGKTTLIRLMTGLLTADSGELKVLDVDVAADPQQVQGASVTCRRDSGCMRT